MNPFQVAFQPFLQQPISFRRLELILLDLPQKEVFQSGIGLRTSRKALLIKWTDQDGAVGYGECSCRPDPYYSDEFIDAAQMLVQQFILPRLPACKTYLDLLDLHRTIRGWPFTKAAVEFALHDLLWRKTGKDLFDYWQTQRISKIPVGISLGIQRSEAQLQEAVARSQAAGYRRLKFKISPRAKVEHFQRVLEASSHELVSFDANGTFYLQDLEKLQQFSAFGNMVEQPFPPGRVDFLVAARRDIPALKVCLDEEIKSLGDLLMAHRLHALDELNLKLGRVGGLFNSLEIADYCLQHQLPCWVGGMFETGIGRSLNLRLASFLPHAQAHDLSPSSRYFQEDVLMEDIDMDEHGYIHLDTCASDVNPDLLKKYAIQWLTYE